MTYMVLTYVKPTAWDNMDDNNEDFQAVVAFMAGLNRELIESGELVSGNGLADPGQAKTIRRQGDAALITDGPYAETKEILGGYWILDCPSAERVLEIASRVVNCSDVIEHTIEVRPILGPDTFRNSSA